MNKDGEKGYLITMQRLKSLLITNQRIVKKLDKLQDQIYYNALEEEGEEGDEDE
jgi:hypothetical protein